jgi:hypothetical protein
LAGLAALSETIEPFGKPVKEAGTTPGPTPQVRQHRHDRTRADGYAHYFGVEHGFSNRGDSPTAERFDQAA